MKPLVSFSRPTLWLIEIYLILSAGFWIALAGFPGWDWYQQAVSDRITDGQILGRHVIARTWNEPKRHTVIYRFLAKEEHGTYFNFKQQEVSPVNYDTLPPGTAVRVAFWSEDPMRSNLVDNPFAAYQTLSLICLGNFFLSLWLLFRRLPGIRRPHRLPAPPP